MHFSPPGRKRQLAISDPLLHRGCAPEKTALPTFAATLKFPKTSPPIGNQSSQPHKGFMVPYHITRLSPITKLKVPTLILLTTTKTLTFKQKNKTQDTMLYYFQTPPTKSLLKLKSKRQKSHVELPTLAATDLASTVATNKPINPLKPNNLLMQNYNSYQEPKAKASTQTTFRPSRLNLSK